MARLQSCPCGSGEFPEALQDGYGIFMCYCCPKCKTAQLSHFRPDIFERYDCDEDIEGEPETIYWSDSEGDIP
jgi:hypothetical protein